jgi:hypothetical protein
MSDTASDPGPFHIDPTTASPIRIEPDGFYDDDLLYAALEVSAATLARARREGRLHYTRQGRRILYWGQWVLDWLQAARKGGPTHAA